MSDLVEARRFRRLLDMLEGPGQRMRHENAVTAGGDGRHDIRFQRIAHHHRPLRPVADLGEDPPVCGRRLVGDDFHRIEEIAKPGLRELALLVEQVALGDQHEQIMPGQRLQGFPHVRQRLDRMGQQVPPDVEDLGDNSRGHRALGNLDGRLDHRQGEALDAETVMGEIAPLGGKQALRDPLAFGVICKKFGEMPLGQLVEVLVLPKGIVGIEADGGQRTQRHSHLPRRFFREEFTPSAPGDKRRREITPA